MTLHEPGGAPGGRHLDPGGGHPVSGGAPVGVHLDPGGPGNPVFNNGNLEEPEDYLDTLGRKVSEIMNKDCSRRSSYHDLGKKDDLYGPLGYGRKRGPADLNHNPTGGFGGPYLGPAPEGAIRFEEDGKASSSEGLDSSLEDLSHTWSDEDNDRYVLRRRR